MTHPKEDTMDTQTQTHRRDADACAGYTLTENVAAYRAQQRGRRRRTERGCAECGREMTEAASQAVRS